MTSAISLKFFAPVVLAAMAGAAVSQDAKNVILMISDGAGITTWQAANQWQFGADAGTGPEFRQRWENEFTQHWMTAFPGHTQPVPPSLTGGQLIPLSLFEGLVFPEFGSYDPAAAWDATPGLVNLVDDDNGTLGRGTPVTLAPNPFLPADFLPLFQLVSAGFNIVSTDGFAAYDYLVTRSVTDSAAAGTALASGVKSYNSTINFDLNEQPVPFITQEMVARGKAAGVVSTKEFTDATPAAFGTQSPARSEEAFISTQMIRNGLLDVIISPGHPEFGSGGVPRPASYGVVSEEDFLALRGGLDGWTLVETASGLEAIADGTAPAPERLFGFVPVSSSLNSRDTSARTNAYDPRFFDPADPNGAVPFVMPDLDTLSMTAINTLKRDEDGFFLMIEGASVDSAAHANDLPRLVEEQLAFNRAIDRVIDWVETESSWDETLVIITTDHANGLLLGPDSATEFMQPPQATGVGELPEVLWWSTNHTNELVPLWTRGPGGELFGRLTDGFDPVRGRYIDNSDVFRVMSASIGVACNAADLAGPVFTLDLDDVDAFIVGFLAADPIADLTGDGAYDMLDVDAFIALFLSGCP